MSKARNLFERIWESHVVEHMEEGSDLLAVDRVLLHDLCGTYAFQALKRECRTVLRPEAVFASPDHTLASCPDRAAVTTRESELYVKPLREGCRKYGITLFDDGDENQGILHLVGPEQGLTLPGSLLVCGDSHTCTHGALGALAYGIGTREVAYALATSCIIARRPKVLELRLTGEPTEGIDVMDVILFILAKYGTKAAVGYAVEYTGEYISRLQVEDRFTICNLTIELGADTAIIAPDEQTYAYVNGRPYAPSGKDWQTFEKLTRSLVAQSGGSYDQTLRVDVSEVRRQISWGVNPAHTIPVDGLVPELTPELSKNAAEGYRKAYEYTKLQAGQPIVGTPVDRVFIGSCSNGGLSAMQKAAEAVRGRRVADGVEAWIVPGSMQVKMKAHALGLDRIFLDAGFHYGEPCCSFCVGSNGELLAAGERCVSTTNRNFVGRQGPGAITHMASVYTAVLAAITGEIR